MKSFLIIALILTCILQIKATKPGSRIIGGMTARAEQFPYAAAIYSQKKHGQYFYGGALLSNQWIITVGQCVDTAISFTIQVGSNSLSNDDSNRLRLSTSEYLLHPEFDPSTFANDIGLIKLRMPITFNEHIQVSYLPSIEIPTYAPVVAIGWGQTSDDTPAPVDELEYVQVTTLSNDECKLVYGDQIDDSMVCIEGNFNEGACTGDSGSPLVQYLSARYTVIVGVFSFMSQSGCETSDPSGYARIFPHVAWIKNVTGVL